jgi:hypothetical protein
MANARVSSSRVGLVYVAALLLMAGIGFLQGLIIETSFSVIHTLHPGSPQPDPVLTRWTTVSLASFTALLTILDLQTNRIHRARRPIRSWADLDTRRPEAHWYVTEIVTEIQLQICLTCTIFGLANVTHLFVQDDGGWLVTVGSPIALAVGTFLAAELYEYARWNI